MAPSHRRTRKPPRAKPSAPFASLGLKGIIINSHTRGEFLDDPKFWDIFEAAEALKVPIYIHPQAPPPQMSAPYVEKGLEGALWGFAAETGLHLLAILRSGALDRFPGLRIVVGHAGEALPFWLYRLDYMNKTARPAIRNGADRLKRTLSEYMRENVYVTTSGMAWAPVITFVQSVLGMDRVLYAMDYPYQFEPDEVTATDNLPISDADKKKLFQTNAERVIRACSSDADHPGLGDSQGLREDRRRRRRVVRRSRKARSSG